MSDQLTYADVADRIEAALGERPALSALRAAAARSETLPEPRNRITAGMPKPTPGPPGFPSWFDAQAIETWLASHPRRTWPKLRRAIADAGPETRPDAVSAARKAGMSWQTIADIIATADGISCTRQGIQQKYGRRG